MPENEEKAVVASSTTTEQQRKVALEIARLLNEELFPLFKPKISEIPKVEAGIMAAMNGILERIHKLTAPFCD